MIRHQGGYATEVRANMRGGDGEVKIEHFWDEKNELKGATRMFARLTLNPGSSIGFHTHEHEEEVFVIVRGTGEVDDNGRSARVRAGDTIHTGDGAGHAIRNVGEEPLEILAVISTY